MAAPAQIFIRDDDVGALTPELRRFFELFYNLELPVSYQIIPERLTAECAEFLLKAREERPELVEFGQHGLRHQMMVRGKLEYYEFGPERTYDEQREDIIAGRELLRCRLGDTPVAVFTPPRHRYDRNTLKALSGQGFSIFSASSYLKPQHRAAYAVARSLRLSSVGARGVPYHGRTRPDCGLHELSISVAADDGANPSGAPDTVLSAAREAVARRSPIGVMFHHQAYRGPDAEARLYAVANGLRAMEGVRFHTMANLLKAGGAR